MSLGADLAAALPGLRAEAESLMVDTVLVESWDGVTVTTNPTTLAEEPAWVEVLTSPARIQRTNALSTSEPVVGGVEYAVDAFIAQFPLGATGIVKGHRVTVTAIGPETDPDLLGLVGTVQANLTKTHPTKRTLVCEEVSS